VASRLLAGALLVAAGVLAWLAITSTLAARALQAIVGISVVYVGYLALRGWGFMRAAIAGATVQSATAATDARAGTVARPAAPPFVSVVVPARNEAMVIRAIVGDLLSQRYGPSSPGFEVVVVDDGSTDATSAIVREAARGASPLEGILHVVSRPHSAGGSTKGAALAAGAATVRGEVIGVVDADARVTPDFLARISVAWQRDPEAAAIQARRQPGNAERSWLTQAQGEEQLMDLASQCGRRAVEGTAELRGNGMFVRRAALEHVGGWSPRAMTEDLDLSTRLAAAGYHVALAPEVIVLEEAVESLRALWWQRMRWAEGSLRRIMELGPRLIAGSAPIARKADFLAFAGEFVIPPLFAASVVASLLTVPLPVRMDWTVPVSLFAGYGLGSLLLALAGLAGTGVGGLALVGRSLRGALFLSHWLVVVPAALAWIAVGPSSMAFRQTARVGHQPPAS
jgi:1,2-diacylglycerol 3-beta-glucosyltransferase